MKHVLPSVRLALSVSVLFLFLLNACDQPTCSNSNSNPIFDQHAPNSPIYKAELAKQLNLIEPNHLSYWLKEYEEKEGEEYLYFDVQGGELCATLVLTVEAWNRLENVREQKGLSYRGAEFTALSYDIQQENGETEFVYTGFGQIVD